MKGDFSRATFDPSRHFTRVLMQQGRVQLDADWNEQNAILLHYLRTLTVDLIGSHGGPEDGAGFEITDLGLTSQGKLDFTISAGRYYVEGIPCENATDLRYRDQPGYPFEGYPGSPEDVVSNGDYLIYLEVWERHLTHLDHPPMREVALGGPDTATRAMIAWRVGIAAGEEIPVRPDERVPRLTARTSRAPVSQDPCVTSPESRYRGPENQLYRVEVHRGGPAGEATFKWSRENGSVVFPVRSVAGERLVLGHLGRDSRLSLEPGDWVEVFDEDYILQSRAEDLLRVEEVDRVKLTVTLSGTPVGIDDDSQNCQVRRWDHRAGKPSEGGFELEGGAGKIVEGDNEQSYLVLEDGVEIQFVEPENYATQYRTGDYWQIPARTATGEIEWPPPGRPDPSPPLGVERFYAPLASFQITGGALGEPYERRCLFASLCG